MIDKNDHKLTAFALGELPEAELLEIEAEVNSNAELLAEVEAIKKIAGEVSEVLLSEPCIDVCDIEEIADIIGGSDNRVAILRKVDEPAANAATIRSFRMRLNFRVTGILSLVIIACVIFVTIIQNFDSIKIAVDNIRPQTNETAKKNAKISLPETGIAATKNAEINQPDAVADLAQNIITEDKGESITVENEKNNAADEINVSQNNIKVDDFLLSNTARNKTAPVLNSPYQDRMSNISGQNLIIQDNMKNQNSNMPPVVFDSNRFSGYQNFNGNSIVNNQSLQQQKMISLPTPSQLSQQNIIKNNSNVIANNINSEIAQTQTQKNETTPPNIVTPENTSTPTSDKTTSDNKTTTPNNTQRLDIASKDLLLPNFRSFSADATKISNSGRRNKAEIHATYDVMRQSINKGEFPPVDKIKINEYVNYFRYDYSGAKNEGQFAIQTDMIQCPWNTEHLLVCVGIKKLADKIDNIDINENTNENTADKNITNKNTNAKTDAKTDAKKDVETDANTDAKEKLSYDKISDRGDGRLSVAIKFDKNKISGYVPVDNIITSEVAIKQPQGGLFVVNYFLGLPDESMLFYEVIPVDGQVANITPQTRKKTETDSIEKSNLQNPYNKNQSTDSTNTSGKVEESAKGNFVINDYFSVELGLDAADVNNKLGTDSKLSSNELLSNNIGDGKNKSEKLNPNFGKHISNLQGRRSHGGISNNNKNDNKAADKINDEAADKVNEDIKGETQFAAAVMLFGLLLQKGGKMENCDWNTVKNLAEPNIKNDEKRKEFLNLVEKASNITPK
ncbi:MAG: von Willebrand factor type A domain-containing protein [Planctomycetaceae bacterium]|jgi:hypothetical protein|nr:von Willebrand factor type A domain-containing protein [Planctomycetaceae bacterium]